MFKKTIIIFFCIFSVVITSQESIAQEDTSAKPFFKQNTYSLNIGGSNPVGGYQNDGYAQGGAVIDFKFQAHNQNKFGFYGSLGITVNDFNEDEWSGESFTVSNDASYGNLHVLFGPSYYVELEETFRLNLYGGVGLGVGTLNDLRDGFQTIEVDGGSSFMFSLGAAPKIKVFDWLAIGGNIEYYHSNPEITFKFPNGDTISGNQSMSYINFSIGPNFMF